MRYINSRFTYLLTYRYHRPIQAIILRIASDSYLAFPQTASYH